MNEAYIPVGPIRTFNCDKCGKERQNKHLNICPICKLKFDDFCWQSHLDKEHKPKEKYIAR